MTSSGFKSKKYYKPNLDVQQEEIQESVSNEEEDNQIEETQSQGYEELDEKEEEKEVDGSFEMLGKLYQVYKNKNSK
ncbi:gas vesicle protein [Desulfitispora alkaliphila]|uniref:hypothetical protein n=1 Tax=Desulfitispora alkaliphila TaxID=622674 RepID=UPI003D21BEDD